MSVTFTQYPLRIPHPQRLYSHPVSNSPLSTALRFASDERKPFRWSTRTFSAGESIGGSSHRDVSGELSLDSLLSVTEILFIVPPAIYSIGCVVGFLIPNVVKPLGSKIFAWQFLSLVGFVAVGSLIRRREWGKVCRERKRSAGVDLISRIEKAEEDLRCSSSAVRDLSMKLEKLGIRFRVTRKDLKEPISETATLAQKNSEAIRALAVQEVVLEKELGEIQKVLLAMQEQQQKQLDLILAIGKAGRVIEREYERKQTSDPIRETT